ncbi:MAG: hypothetical protein R3342_13430 [Lutibacter sp.]|uniref:hypothetical protein n=1 Tax=Lutibacter sp. TaxID=1925666 RepID=UPI00299D9797|nr:hypothetical protein [Lutibacter sp.]MDX1830536.1 hypothetical protein [Lutibacter sp.]
MIIPRFIGALIRYIYESFRGNREPFFNFLESDKKPENKRFNIKLGFGLISIIAVALYIIYR